MTIQTLADLLEEAGTQTEAEALRGVANTVMAFTEVKREHNGKGRARTYNGDIDAIAEAARQLADMVLLMVEGREDANAEIGRLRARLDAVPVDSIKQVAAEWLAHGMRHTGSVNAIYKWLETLDGAA